MKTLVLHIGTYKTGSTSLQNALYQNADHLLKKGINYLGHQGGCSTHNGRQNFQRRLSKSDFATYLSEEPGHIHIFSNECLWDRESAKKKILPVILDTPIYDRVLVIAYVRKQSDFVESFYKQEHKYGSKWAMGRSPMSFYRELCDKGTLDIGARLDSYAALFGKENIIVKPYKKSNLVNGDVIDDFLATDLFGGVSIQKPMALNESTSADEALFKASSASLIRYLNKHTKLSLSPKRVNALADQFMALKCEEFSQNRRESVFTDEEKFTIDQFFVTSNKLVESSYDIVIS